MPFHFSRFSALFYTFYELVFFSLSQNNKSTFAVTFTICSSLIRSLSFALSSFYSFALPFSMFSPIKKYWITFWVRSSIIVWVQFYLKTEQQQGKKRAHRRALCVLGVSYGPLIYLQIIWDFPCLVVCVRECENIVETDFYLRWNSFECSKSSHWAWCDVFRVCAPHSTSTLPFSLSKPLSPGHWELEFCNARMSWFLSEHHINSHTQFQPTDEPPSHSHSLYPHLGGVIGVSPFLAKYRDETENKEQALSNALGKQQMLQSKHRSD